MILPPLTPLIALIATFVAVILFEVFGKRAWIKEVSVAGVFLAFACLFQISYASGPLLKFDQFTFFFSLIFLSVTLLVLLSSHESTAAFAGSVLLSTIGMVLASAANDLILLYIAIELVTSPTYVLVAYSKTGQRMEAAVKYFVVGMIASTLLLLGLVLLAAGTGTLTISAMNFTASPVLLLAFAALVAGLGFKLGIFPFNFWIPDVYQGSKAEVGGLLAGASKKAAYAAFLRLAVVFMVFKNWGILFAVIAALTMTIASFAALIQLNVKRLLAYSIMAQAGFLLMGIAAATSFGYTATVFHAFTHAFMVLGAFLVLGVFASQKVETLEHFKGIGWKNPFLAGSLTIFLLSLAGIPLFSGFVSKFYLVYATAEAGLLWLAVLAILNSVVALFFYFKIIRAMYAYPGGGHPFRVRLGTRIAIIVCLLITIIAGVYPQPFVTLATKAVQALF